MFSDENHRRLIELYIKRIEYTNSLARDLAAGEPDIDQYIYKIEVEKPYNHYGRRGNIDIFDYNLRNANIIEVKSLLDNLGEGIRQLKNAKIALTATGEITGKRCLLSLITYLNDHNVQIMHKSRGILRHIDENFSVVLYCENTGEWFDIPSIVFTNEFIKKNGDLVETWLRLCNKGLKARS